MIDNSFCDYDDDALFEDSGEEFLDEKSCSDDLKEFLFCMMEIFFKDKSWYIGGPIPKSEIYSENNISLIFNSDFDSRTFDFIHKNCLSKIRKPKDFVDDGLSWEVCFLLSLIKDMKSKSIPKKIQPGFLLMYFKICKGFEIPFSFFNKCTI